MYQCTKCAKSLPTLNSLCLHSYDHQPKIYSCSTCKQDFVYQSKLKQHQRKHVTQKLYQYFHGGCKQKYKHPQDLTQHIASDQRKSHECDFCEKTFTERRLLKRHLAVHRSTPAYTCTKCGTRFHHNNQLYHHWKKRQ